MIFLARETVEADGILKPFLLTSSFSASILIWEQKLTESSVESFAANIRTENHQAMVNSLLKVLEKRDSETKPRQMFKRLSEALKQVRTTQNKRRKA